MQAHAQTQSVEVSGKEKMKFLLDTNPPDVRRFAQAYPDLVAGQLICPTHSRANWGGVFAMDNAAFTTFNARRFQAMQERNHQHRGKCLFVACPDIVGNMRRTLELWRNRHTFWNGFDLCLVLQDGAEDMDIPWHETNAVFIGGVDPWKESAACRDLIKTALTLGRHVHCGRVNQIKRFEYMSGLGVHTCDGSGVVRYGFHQLLQIVKETNGKEQRSLFCGPSETESVPVGDSAVEV